MLQQASLEGLLKRGGRGLDTVIGEGGMKISGGEKQRLSIARALLRQPELLVFDEATSSLDSLTEEEISQTIRDIAAGRDAITCLIAHRLSTVMHADRIYVLERGRIVEFGSHSELLRGPASITPCGASRWASAPRRRSGCMLQTMRRRIAIVGALFCAGLCAQDGPVFRVDVDMATVACVVTDEHGIAVRDLRRDEFRVYDDGGPREIRSVWADGDLPLVVGIIIDASDSQRALWRRHEATVERFLAAMIRPGDRAFVVAVNSSVILRSEVIGGLNGLRRVVLGPGGDPLGPPCPVVRKRPVCGGTALWNAVYASANLKLRRFPGSKALVILSDGDDTGSTRSLDEAVDEVRRAGGVVYAVKYPSGGRSGRNSLQRLARETGGVLIDPAGDEYRTVLERIEKDLRNRYVIGFRADPPTGGPGERRIRVAVTRPGLMVRLPER